jgi:hypothetical protein
METHFSCIMFSSSYTSPLMLKNTCLDNCSAFKFENYLQQQKKRVYSGRRPLLQISKRVQERTVRATPRQQVIKMKQPNNDYIPNDRSCCEVVSLEDAFDTYL